MRSLRLLLITIALLVCFQTVLAAPRHALVRRQDDNEPTASASAPTESSRPSPTSHSRGSSSSRPESDRHSVTGESTPHSTISVTSTTASSSSSATAPASVATNGTEPSHVSEDPLPLHPKITPALGLIGTILMVSGALYTVIGIKNKWIYVFGSAAYLAALAVTVLIVYLMNPPVSNAVQGAFFVAAFFTGALFGALALLFSDLTEGLGCLLGGFCLSMWFLSLKEGGLITSTGGRAIFIGCMSAAGYCLSFSHYTRTHGLIGSVSFSGATITMLGVDCFSRAGWKEFWLYLWNLNPSIFPLGTTTYPMTKGLKAELAGVVILTIFGIISQLRLWKLIKERRAKREEREQEVAENQQRQEEELGIRIEDKVQRERREWEATYGDKSLSDSKEESGSTTPQSQSLYEKEFGSSTTGSKVDDAPSTDKKTTVTVASVQEDEIQQIDATGAPISKEDVVPPPSDISRSNSVRPYSEVAAASHVSRSVSITSSLKPSSPPPPVVVPLPFRIPKEDDAQSQLSDNASVSAIPDIEDDTPLPTQEAPNHRLSNRPTMKRLSTARSSVQGFQSEDVGMMSYADSDRASSVAATLDEEDDISVRELSPPQSPVSAGVDSEAQGSDQLPEKSKDVSLNSDGIEETRDDSAVALVENATTARTAPIIEVQPAEDEHEVDHAGTTVSSPTERGPSTSLTISTDPTSDDARSKCDPAQSPRLRHDTLVRGGSDPSSGSQDEKVGSIAEDLSKALPARLSKVAQSYRTNEWAKHLESAERPEVDEISEPSSPGAQLDHERPAPVSEGIAQPFAVGKRASKRVSSESSNVHRDNAFMQINSNSTRHSQGDLSRLSRGGSQIRVSMSQQPSAVDLGSRRISSSPLQVPSQTLMGKRESLMRNRVSSQNFNQQMASTNDLSGTVDEDMTLAQRRRALQHQKPPSASQKWKKSSLALSPQMDGFDSHQPKRTVGSGSDERREELLAGWRGSAQQNGALRQGAVAMEEQQRVAMMNAKRQKEMEQQQQAAIAQQRESMRHTMMRSNEMLDAHRDAMRRMQASANRRA